MKDVERRFRQISYVLPNDRCWYSRKRVSERFKKQGNYLKLPVGDLDYRVSDIVTLDHVRRQSSCEAGQRLRSGIAPRAGESGRWGAGRVQGWKRCFFLPEYRCADITRRKIHGHGLKSATKCIESRFLYYHTLSSFFPKISWILLSSIFKKWKVVYAPPWTWFSNTHQIEAEERKELAILHTNTAHMFLSRTKEICPDFDPEKVPPDVRSQRSLRLGLVFKS